MTGTDLHQRLLEGSRLSREQYADAFSVASAVEAQAMEAGDVDAHIRAVALQGTLQINRGWIDEACATAARLAVARADDCDDPHAAVAVAGFHARLGYFLGSYRDALASARRALVIAEAHGDPQLELNAINETFLVLGNLLAPGLTEILQDRFRLAREVGDHWQQALAHNDRGFLLAIEGRLEEADVELVRGRNASDLVDGPVRCLQAVLRTTEGEIRLMQDRPEEALILARSARLELEVSEAPNPYLVGAIAMVAVQAYLALGRRDDAVVEGRECIERLGRYLPKVRGAILHALAEPLREAGRIEEAFAALSESVELEREAANQFAALQQDLNRALVDHDAARLEAERLRYEADCDPLTGLRNRRALASIRLAEEDVDAVGVVLVDVDHFKQINDRHGHEIGDRVLVRIAQIMVSVARSEDLLMRMGGDEFVVVMVGANRAAARAFADRLQSAFVAEDWSQIEWSLQVGVSIGVSAGGTDRSLPDLIAAADGKMYQAKAAGRGQVAGGD